MMAEFAAKSTRIFVVWEPVLFTDWLSPSTATLGRISHKQTAQFVAGASVEPEWLEREKVRADPQMLAALGRG